MDSVKTQGISVDVGLRLEQDGHSETLCCLTDVATSHVHGCPRVLIGRRSI